MTPPNLRIFTNIGRSISSRNPLLNARLADLNLEGVENVWNDTVDLASTLRGWPELEKLRISTPSSLLRHSELAAEKEMGTIAFVAFPRLRSLSISDNIYGIAAIFRQLRLPITCSISILGHGESQDTDFNDRTITKIIETLNLHYVDSGMLFRYAHSSLREREDDYFSLDGGNLCKPEQSTVYPDQLLDDDGNVKLHWWRTNPRLYLALKWSLLKHSTIHTAQTMLDSISVFHGIQSIDVTTFLLTPPPEHHIYTWDFSFAGQTELRWVQLDHRALGRFLLLDIASALQALEKVETIAIKKAYFTPGSERSKWAASRKPLDVGRLHWYLTNLVEFGRLQKVILTKCFIDSPFMVNYLRSAVGEDRWSWDGKVRGWMSE